MQLNVKSRELKPTTQPLDSRSKIPCRFFSRGCCQNGDSCTFAHSLVSESVVSAAIRPPSSSGSQIPCQFFARGCCRNGENCPFAHFMPGGGVEDSIEIEVIQNEDNWTRELCGTLAQFDDGARVSKISLPSDFSTVRINMLPTSSTPASVADLLANMKIDVPTECIRVSVHENAAHSSADIRVQRRPSFTKILCNEINSREVFGVEGSHLVAVPIASPILHGTNLRRVDCKKVHCSWHKSSRTAWLNFGNRVLGQKVSDKFTAGSYKVLGRDITSSRPVGSKDWRNPVAWTVTLTDVPATATKEDVCHSIASFYKPRHVELSTPTYEADDEMTKTMVKSMLLKVGPLEWWEASADLGGKRAKAKARFEDESAAREAVATLNNTILPFNNKGRLTVQLVNTAKFKILIRIYDAVQNTIDGQKQEWRDQHLQFTAYPPHRGYRALRVEGEKSKDVAQAKNELEIILAGDIAMKGDQALWSPAFNTNGSAYQKMKMIERSLGVVIVRNKRKSQLRIYGTQIKCKEAEQALAELVREDESRVYAIELDAAKFSWACHGGFNAICTALGEKNIVTFDIVSVPKRILITGSEADYDAAVGIVVGQQQHLGRKQKRSSTATGNMDCTVCWNEADNPVETRCHHIYCLECFESLCQSSVVPDDSGGDFCIHCHGDMGKCSAVFSLDEIQERLSSSTFEDVLDASFASYVRRRPQEFRYCPTPDCKQVFRTSTSSSGGSDSGSAGDNAAPLFTCTHCLVATCTSCYNSSHDGIACAEYKGDEASSEYRATLKALQVMGVKNCPECKTSMEKTEGCDHMTCGGCGTHICWKCMTTFPESWLCYSHIYREHGGVGLGLPAYF